MKGWLLRKQGASLYYGRRYFQKYVGEAAKKEVKDIFGGTASVSSPRLQGSRLLSALTLRESSSSSSSSSSS